MGNNQNIDIEIKEDGIYLILDNTNFGKKPTRSDALKIIEEYGITDIDFPAVNALFKKTDAIVSGKISSNKTVRQQNEGIEINISKDRLTAQIVFKPPVNKGARATQKDIVDAIENAGIRHGILTNLLIQLTRDRVHETPYVIAQGTAPVDGTDGYVEMHVDTSKKTLRPKLQEDGRVDYHNLDLIEMVSAGDLLATSIPPIEGQDGTDVTGKAIPVKKAKPAPPLPKGKNTTVNEAGDKLISDINGQISFDGKRISVLPVLEIAGNVDNSTGDITFNGAVVVRKNVVTGFSIVADGDIEVYGVVEGATLMSNANITVKSGVQGQDRANITALGSISVKFAENCSMDAGGDVVAESIMHSNIKCGGSVDLKGKKALLVGGSVTAGLDIHSAIIGSPLATVTELEAGFRPEIITEYKRLQAEHVSIKVEYDKLGTIVDSFSKQNQIQPLDEDKRRIFLKMVRTKALLRTRLMSTQEKIQELTPLLTKSNGKVSAAQVIRAGVKVSIGNAVMYVKDDRPSATLRNVDSRIVIGAYTGEL